MNLRPIKTDEDYETMLEWIDTLFDINPAFESFEGEQLQIALLLVKAHEDIYYPIPKPNALEIVKQKMEEKGLKNKDLVEMMGSKGYVSALLSGKKPLTLKIAKIFHHQLGIPAEVLLA